MSKNVYRSGELRESADGMLLGERPGISKLRTRYLRDIEDEITRLQRELADLRGTYEREAKTLVESYGAKKSSLEAELAEVRRQSETESKRIRDGAAAEVEAAKQRGYDDGLARGRREGETTAAQSVAQLLAETRRQITAARQAFLDRILAADTRLLDASLHIAEQIIRQKIAIDPDVVTGAVREAIAHIEKNNPIQIRVHPSDIERLEQVRNLSPESFKDRDLTFVPDESISPGGCVAETGLEFIDATIDKKLETLRDRLIPRSVV